MQLKFITGEPALLMGRSLVIADLHLGAEHDYRAAGIRMPSRTQEVQGEIEALIRKTRAERLIILGDIKHKVPGISFQEEREVPEFLSRLAKCTGLRPDERLIEGKRSRHTISIEVVPGNHDGWLAKLCPGITVHSSEGMMLGGFYLSHGHAWPGKEALGAEAIIMGHNHPQVEFRDRLGKVWRERVWVRAGMKRGVLRGHYPNLPRRLPDLLLTPAFSTLVGGWAVNKPGDKGRFAGGLGPITRCACMKDAVAYLLDGTFLGEVSSLVY